MDMAGVVDRRARLGYADRATSARTRGMSHARDADVRGTEGNHESVHRHAEGCAHRGADGRTCSLLLACGPDRAIRRAACALARRAAGGTTLVDEGRQASSPRVPRRPAEIQQDRRGRHRPQRHTAVGPVLGSCAHPRVAAMHGRPDPHLRPNPRRRGSAVGADSARPLPNLVRRGAACRSGSRAARLRGPDQALQGRRASRRCLCRGIRRRFDAQPPYLGRACR